jgi:hypothetical protein
VADRGSIFRLHAGAALLERDRESMGEMPTWGQGSSAPRLIRHSETAHERRVSALGSMSVLWVEIPDEASPQSSRAYIERNAIGLLSNNMRPFDSPSKTWLGLHSPPPEIRNGGLWNLNYAHEQYDPAFLDALAAFVSQTIKRCVSDRMAAPNMPFETDLRKRASPVARPLNGVVLGFQAKLMVPWLQGLLCILFSWRCRECNISRRPREKLA